MQAHNLASPLDFAITVPTTTAEPEGRAGLAYSAVRAEEGLNDPAYLFGLRQDAANRSNVALQNMGTTDEGDIALRVAVFSGDPGQLDPSKPQQLPDVTLSPG